MELDDLAKKRDDDDEDEEEEPRERSKGPAQRIPQHKHCLICNKAIPAKQELCSEECETRYNAIKAKQKNWMYIMYAMIFILLIFVVMNLL